MIDIRFHIISLCAVFIALSIGVIVGSSIGPSQAHNLANSIKQQNKQIDALTADYKAGHDQLSRLNDAFNQIVPPLIAGKLTGNRIAIIQTGSYPDTVRQVADALTASGGEVASTTVVSSEFDTLTPDDETRIRGELTGEAQTDDSVSDMLSPLGMALRVGAPLNSQTDNNLSALRRERLIQTTGDMTEPVSMVVIVGGSDPTTFLAPSLAQRESDIIDLVSTGNHIAVIGGEPQGAIASSVKTYSEKNIASVDCLDIALGRLDMVYALLGEHANFGIKSTADRTAPSTIVAPAGLRVPISKPVPPTPTVKPIAAARGHR